MSIRGGDPAGIAPQVGPYTLLTRLGEGGMGIVHLAQGRDGRRVALKVLRPQVVGDEEARGRLAREVGSLTRIRSPWIAEMLDADPWAEVPYVVTRYVPGFSLHEHVATEGPIVGSDLLWLAGCLAEGLAAVHAAGVLHRDVKPGNVLMEGRTPILIDFGLARVAEDVRLTQTGWLLGTPGYLAPEILYGDDATAAADVHAWAATVAYAATGRAPYGRGPAMAVMDRTRRGQHDLTGIDEPLAGVLAAALSPDPLDRPLLEEVLAWVRPLSTRPELAPAPPPGVFLAPGADGAASEQPDLGPPTVLRTAPTLPLALAHPHPAPPPDADALARMERQWDDAHGLAPAGPTRPTDRDTLLETGGAGDPDAPTEAIASLAPAPRPPVAERLRRWSVIGLGAVVVGSAASAAPWITVATLALLVWLLRAGSLASTAVAERRSVRGQRWHDGPRWVVTAPWHLLRAVTGAGVLLAWSVGLAAAAGLLCYAVALDVATSLMVTGAAFALALWTGPESGRLRSPLQRVLVPAAAATLPWLATCAVLLGAAISFALLQGSSGISWAPWVDGPFGL